MADERALIKESLEGRPHASPSDQLRLPSPNHSIAETCSADLTGATVGDTNSEMDNQAGSSIWGGYDATDENSLDLLQDVADSGLLKRRTKLPADSPSPSSITNQGSDWFEHMKDELSTPLHHELRLEERQRLDLRTGSPAAPLFILPPELIHAVFSHLSAQDLVALSATCHHLRAYALSEFQWYRCVQRNVPGLSLTTSNPCATYRELYVAHHLWWFLPKYKIWFCDRDLMGKLILVRYDPRRGCIEGLQLLAVSHGSIFEHWSANEQVVIHGFNPELMLHLEKPVLQFKVQDRETQAARGFASRPGANRFSDEVPMALDERLGAMYKNFMLTRPLDPEVADARLTAEYPYENVWPPPAIPARHHVSGARAGQGVVDLSPEDRPQSRSQVSDQTFRIRQWMELAGTPLPPETPGGEGNASNAFNQFLASLNADRNFGISVHIGEEIITYSTLDPVLYTPTILKPWRGIWVGDYSGHGCEFLLMNQPDDPPATDAELGLVREDAESEAVWKQRRLDARIYRGRLEAIKLTGDPNIPRGEYTFVADDIGPGGYVGTAVDEVFRGSRIVQSKGHIAAAGFFRDKYIESRLIMISPNKLAQHWLGFGHISYFERVDIDTFLKP